MVRLSRLKSTSEPSQNVPSYRTRLPGGFCYYLDMKLLLTSGGISNPTLVKEFLSLAGKPASELKIAFIPTAMHPERGDKGWMINELLRLRDLGVGQLDIVDISAVPKDIWLPRLEESNVIFVNGGNTTHLMTWFNKSGLTEEIPQLLENRVYVGLVRAVTLRRQTHASIAIVDRKCCRGLGLWISACRHTYTALSFH